MRLNKYLALCGVASRRGADDLIAAGHVQVNGSIVREMGTVVDPEKDVVMCDGKLVKKAEDHVYYAVNKPVGYVSTVEDEHAERTVMDLVKSEERLYPVGRLDKDSEGLIILTNDGELAYRLTHPKHKIPKTYQVTVRGKVSEDRLNRLREGVDLEDGISAPCEVKVLQRTSDGAVLEFILHEGRKRQIRRMCAEVHFFVLKLVRVKIGNLELGNLKLGKWKLLTENDIRLFS